MTAILEPMTTAPAGQLEPCLIGCTSSHEHTPTSQLCSADAQEQPPAFGPGSGTLKVTASLCAEIGLPTERTVYVTSGGMEVASLSAADARNLAAALYYAVQVIEINERS